MRYEPGRRTRPGPWRSRPPPDPRPQGLPYPVQDGPSAGHRPPHRLLRYVRAAWGGRARPGRRRRAVGGRSRGRLTDRAQAGGPEALLTTREGPARRLVEPAVLHDHEDPRPVLQDPDVVEGVALDEEEAGAVTRLDRAKVVGPPHDLGAEPGRRHERLHRREAEEVDEVPEVPCVGAVRVPGKAVVSARQHADPALTHPADGIDGHLELALESARPHHLRREAPGAAGAVAEVPGGPDRGDDEEAVAAGFEE